MAAGDTSLGTGTTLTFAGFTADIINIDWTGRSRPSVEVPHMGTTGAAPVLLGKIYSLGEIVVAVHFAGNEDYDTPLGGAAASLVITFADGSIWTQTAGMVGFDLSAPLEDVMTGTATFKPVTKAAIT